MILVGFFFGSLTLSFMSNLKNSKGVNKITRKNVRIKIIANRIVKFKKNFGKNGKKALILRERREKSRWNKKKFTLFKKVEKKYCQI